MKDEYDRAYIVLSCEDCDIDEEEEEIVLASTGFWDIVDDCKHGEICECLIAASACVNVSTG